METKSEKERKKEDNGNMKWKRKRKITNKEQLESSDAGKEKRIGRKKTGGKPTDYWKYMEKKERKKEQ